LARDGFATARGTSATGFAPARFGTDRGVSATGFARGNPTSAPSGGGSGARTSPGARRTASTPTTTIAATRATPRHLIRTPAIPP
jgi:hypothetical protein